MGNCDVGFVIICRIVWRFSACSQSTSSLSSFRDIAKTLHCVFWTCLAMTSKNNNASLSKTLCLSSCKKIHLSLNSFLKYYKDIANLLFWVFWACLVCRKICLSANKMFICKHKINWILQFFFTLKNPAIWSTKKIFPDMEFPIESQ